MSNLHKVHQQIQGLEQGIKKVLGNLELGQDVKIHQKDLRGDNFYLSYKKGSKKGRDVLENLLLMIKSTYNGLAIRESYDEKRKHYVKTLTLRNSEIRSGSEVRIRYGLLSNILKGLENYKERKC